MNLTQPRSLGNTVVGLLFTKTGKEIRSMASIKVEGINDEVKRLEDSTKDVTAFVKEKEGELISLSDFYMERRENKSAAARPYQRQLEEVYKAWSDTEFEFNQDTNNLIGEKAVTFEKGFERFEERFSQIAELAEQVDNTRMEVSGVMRSLPGVFTDKMDGNLAITGAAQGMEYPERTARAVQGTSGLPTREDKAAAKLAGLRSKVDDAQQKLTLIGRHVKNLKAESERLRLVYKHLSDQEIYTLDLESLIALGFGA